MKIPQALSPFLLKRFKSNTLTLTGRLHNMQRRKITINATNFAFCIGTSCLHVEMQLRQENYNLIIAICSHTGCPNKMFASVNQGLPEAI